MALHSTVMRIRQYSYGGVYDVQGDKRSRESVIGQYHIYYSCTNDDHLRHGKSRSLRPGITLLTAKNQERYGQECTTTPF
jgi:hypothetical protein